MPFYRRYRDQGRLITKRIPNILPSIFPIDAHAHARAILGTGTEGIAQGSGKTGETTRYAGTTNRRANTTPR